MLVILKDQVDRNLHEVESAGRSAGNNEALVFQAKDRDSITSDIVFADGFISVLESGYAEPDGSVKIQMILSVTQK